MTATQKYYLRQNIAAFKKEKDKAKLISDIKQHKESRERFYQEYRDGKGLQTDVSYNNAKILIRLFDKNYN